MGKNVVFVMVKDYWLCDAKELKALENDTYVLTLNCVRFYVSFDPGLKCLSLIARLKVKDAKNWNLCKHIGFIDADYIKAIPSNAKKYKPIMN